jgi:hypothetical protein
MTDKKFKKDKPAPPRPENSEKSLTIPARRLAGSARCLNCGTPLAGPFCYYCGQPDKNFVRFFPVLLREFLEDFLELDSRFTRTMKPLLFLPGKLTRDYLDGRRFRYTPPLRLYIFSSMIFFILAAMLAGSAIKISSSDLSDTGIVTALSIESADPEKLEPQPADEPAVDSDSNGFMAHLADEIEDDDDTININGEPWDKETNPLIIPLMPEFVNDWVNDEIEESPQKGKEIEANPNLIIDKVFEVLPVTMFILLPLVALLLKFWYMFAGKYYIEHLILALHNHSFLFVVFLLSMLLNSLAGWLDPNEEEWITAEAGLPAELDNDRGQVLRHQPVLPDPAFPGDFGRGGHEFCFALIWALGKNLFFSYTLNRVLLFMRDIFIDNKYCRPDPVGNIQKRDKEKTS